MNAIAGFRKCTLSNEELLKAVDSGFDKIYKDGKIPSRHIPARPNKDLDLLVGELLIRFEEQANDDEQLISMESQRMAWSIKTFPEATAISSLRKLEEEIKEIETNLNNNVRDPEEYADALMCLFDSAGRAGISPGKIIQAFGKKLEKNKSRKWTKNPDNSYSHIKENDSVTKGIRESQMGTL